MPFATVAIPFDSYASIPAGDRWLLICLARYADRDGRCWPGMRTLAVDARMSLASISRHLASLEGLGVFQRERKPGKVYVYQLAEAFRPQWPSPPAQPYPRQDSDRQTRYAGHRERNRNPSHHTSPPEHCVPPRGTEARPYKHEEYLGDQFKWRARLRQWHEFGRWVQAFGPRPDEPGCLVPRELLGAGFRDGTPTEKFSAGVAPVQDHARAFTPSSVM